jgi:hypothetical protein
MADKDTKNDKDEITPVGPGADEDTQGAADTSAEGDGYTYEEEGEGREQQAGDERTGHGEEEPEGEGHLSREQKRRRRKRAAYEESQRELGFLRARNEQLERERSQQLASIENRQTQNDVLAIDSRISQAEANLREAETLYVEARRKNDPDSEIEALRVRDSLSAGLNNLRGLKQQTQRAAQQRQTAANQPPTTDPGIQARASVWQRENSWFNPQSGDEDSVIAGAIERRLFNEGRLDPKSDAYWDELDRRLSHRLPERYGGRDADDDEGEPRTQRRANGNGRTNGNGNTPRRATGPTIKVGGRERTLGKGEVYIDEDRKAAMIEAGVWDDPKLRQKYLESYQRYDREASRRPR